MNGYLCNPLNVQYRYQFNKNPMGGSISINREAADPSMIYFKEQYYIFASMTLGVWVSDDLVHWESKRLSDALPLYDYAPDACVIGDYVYICACKINGNNSFYRTKDILNGPYEEIKGVFNFSDPCLFYDDDKKVFLYWGLSNDTPIWGVELSLETLTPVGEKCDLIYGDPYTKGFERVGEGNTTLPCNDDELEKKLALAFEHMSIPKEDSSNLATKEMLKSYLRNAPFIEGSWMNKHRGKYYLQYAAPGTEFNVYGDSVYVSENPLGPFTLAKNNPFSFKPGGFIPGAGHGSTLKDKDGTLWHTSTMRISVQHNFERRVGIWPAGFDVEDELFCNQRYGDWPIRVDKLKINPWANPEWFLLSYDKPVTASSYEDGKGPEKSVDENVQTWWRAVGNNTGEWLEIDLMNTYSVHAIQVNFADDIIETHIPLEKFSQEQSRYIEETEQVTRWILEGSVDKESYFIIEDKSNVQTDLPHDLIIHEEGIRARYIKLTVIEVPYAQKPCISGLRVFGCGEGPLPDAPEFSITKSGDTDIDVAIESSGAVGYNILWGHSPEKLYHSHMVFGTWQRIGALVKSETYYVRVDAFNENGIIEGKIKKAEGAIK